MKSPWFDTRGRFAASGGCWDEWGSLKTIFGQMTRVVHHLYVVSIQKAKKQWNDGMKGLNVLVEGHL